MAFVMLSSVPWGRWEFSQNAWEAQLTDISADLRELSEPWNPGDRVKAAIDRAARACGLPYWRTFDLWYGKTRRIEPNEIECVAIALEKKRREATRNELHELRTRLLRLESLLAQSDPDFHRPSVAATREHIRALDGIDGVDGRAMAANPGRGTRR